MPSNPGRPEGASARGSPPRARPRPFAPKDPRRVRYYKASLVAAAVFVLLALAFPLWLDHVRRSRDRESFDALRSRQPQVEAPVAARAASTATGQLPYAPSSGNPTCQAYASARCNALGIPPGPCGDVLATALAVPAAGGLSRCRTEIEPKLAEIARVYTPESAVPSPEPTGRPPSEEADRVPAAAMQAGPEPAPAPKAGPAAAATTATPVRPQTTLSAEERADNLARIHVLVEELQRGAQNYATLPAAQAQRFEELRRRVEADGSDEMRALYNTLLLQHGRTAGLAMPPPGVQASESPVTAATPEEGPAKGSTPEMDRVRQRLEQVQRESGRPLVPPPAAGAGAPPVSVDPSTAQAPPAVGL